MSPKRVVLAIVLALGEVAEFGRGDVCFIPLEDNFGLTSEVIRNLPKAALGIAR